MQSEASSKIDQLKRWAAENQLALKAAGVAIIVATYSGSGDEGSFDGVEALGEDQLSTDYKVPEEIKALLEELADELAAPGYEDNDGGGGDVRLTVDTGTITHESYYYYVERNVDQYQEF